MIRGTQDDQVVSEASYRSGDVARMCAVCTNTAVRWIDSGRLVAFLTPGGHRRVRAKELCRFLLEYQIPVPPQVLEAAKAIAGRAETCVAPRLDQVDQVAAPRGAAT